jgi:D-glycero-D-manno-heptose 1,7-bisphosphate phosphatase
MKAVFLDRDGIINVERGDYTWKLPDFEIMPGIIDQLRTLKKNLFKLIIITNQAGIAKGLYTHEDVLTCHAYFQKESDNIIDKLYYAPGHPSVSESLSRKPDSLLFEKAISKYELDPQLCWMVGDKERDLIPAKKLGLNTILINNHPSTYADHVLKSVNDITSVILG